MDAVAALLDGPRARGAFLLRSVMDPPWSLRIRDEAPLTLVAVVDGEAWILPDGGAAERLRRGDVAIVRGPGHYTVADGPATPPQVVIHPGQRCTTPDGEDLGPMRDLGVRTWGNRPDGATVLLTGTYAMDGEVSRRLLRALPPLLVLSEARLDSPLVGLLADEIVKDAPGQEAVLDRLLDLLLIAVLRAWFARPEAEAPALVPGPRRPRGGRRAARAAPPPRAPLDPRGARGRRRGVARDPRPPLRRAGRRAAARVPHRLAHRARRRPAARAGGDGRVGGPSGRATAAPTPSAPPSSAFAA